MSGAGVPDDVREKRLARLATGGSQGAVKTPTSLDTTAQSQVTTAMDLDKPIEKAMAPLSPAKVPRLLGESRCSY